MGLYGVSKRKGQAHQKTIDRVNILVRLELANPLLTAPDIAKLAGLTMPSLIRVKNLPLYKQIHNQYMTGVITRLDIKVDDGYQLARETLKFAVPVALQNLVAQALNSKDERVKNKACNDLLDREGTFAKTTRTDVTVKDQVSPVTDEDKSIADQLLAAKNSAVAPIVTPAGDPNVIH